MEPQLRYFDAHVHLLDYEEQVLPKILEQAFEAGVHKVVCNTTCEQQYEKLEIIANKFKQVQILKSFGIHPYKVGQVKEGWEQRLEEKLKQSQTNLVGEIGLDYRKQVLQNNPKEKQIDVFDKQVQLACKYNRTISVHCVRAHGQMLKYFKKLYNTHTSFPNVVMHSYGGSKQITKSLIKFSPKLNMYFSLCQKRNDDLCDIIPLDKLIFQTDAPYQLDQDKILEQKPYKQDQNELKFIRTNSVLHAKYGKDVTFFINQIWKNSLKAFKLLL